VKGRQVHGGKCAEEAAFERGAVNFGKGAGGGVFHQEDFRVFGVVRPDVHQGFNEQAVGDRDNLALVQRHPDAAEVKIVPFGSEFVPRDDPFKELFQFLHGGRTPSKSACAATLLRYGDRHPHERPHYHDENAEHHQEHDAGDHSILEKFSGRKLPGVISDGIGSGPHQ
jgi:hypothetical protein